MTDLNSKGPKFNKSSLRPILGLDQLGIQNVAILIANQLQSGITSITPRARYWSFFVWVLYDFIQHAPDKSNDRFKVYLKRQEWYFILGNIAYAKKNNIRIHDLMGSTMGLEAWESGIDPVEEKTDYLKNPFGGYGTYRNVLKILGLTSIADETSNVQIDAITKVKGKEIAQKFEQSIQHTIYYQNYRFADAPVPRDVILEYGASVSLDGLTQNNAKDYQTLLELFLPTEPNNDRQKYRKQSMQYYLFLVSQSNNNKMNFEHFQDLMFDDFYNRKFSVPNHLQTVAKGWEIYQARQYFTYSMESIWSFTLEKMAKVVSTKNELINRVLTSLESNSIDLSKPTKYYEVNLPIEPSQRQQWIRSIAKQQEFDVLNYVWQPLLIILDINKRLQNREDFDDFHHDLLNFGDTEDISFSSWSECVNRYRDQPISDLIVFILKYLIIDQHQRVALNKLVTTKNDTYHFVENEGKLFFLHDDKPTFNIFRVFQGMMVLEDLGLLKTVDGKHVLTDLGQVKMNETN